MSNISVHFSMFGLTTNYSEYFKFSFILKNLIFKFFIGFLSDNGLATIQDMFMSKYISKNYSAEILKFQIDLSRGKSDNSSEIHILLQYHNMPFLSTVDRIISKFPPCIKAQPEISCMLSKLEKLSQVSVILTILFIIFHSSLICYMYHRNKHFFLSLSLLRIT